MVGDDSTAWTRRDTLRRGVGLATGLSLAGCLRLSQDADTADGSPAGDGTPSPAGTPTPASSPSNTATPESATPDEEDDTDVSQNIVEWLSDADNFTGTVVDRTGQDTLTVAVGPRQNSFSFDPAAVTVDSGTTVVWEWTGYGGAHNVVAADGSFSSGEAVSEAGFTFERAFSTPGIYRYLCRPHRGVGMKGIVEVV
jgi:halocyanin-like protein